MNYLLKWFRQSHNTMDLLKLLFIMYSYERMGKIFLNDTMDLVNFTPMYKEMLKESLNFNVTIQNNDINSVINAYTYYQIIQNDFVKLALYDSQTAYLLDNKEPIIDKDIDLWIVSINNKDTRHLFLDIIESFEEMRDNKD